MGGGHLGIVSADLARHHEVSVARCAYAGVLQDCLLVRTGICAGTLMAGVQVMCRLVHSTWQDQFCTVAFSSVGMGCKEWCKVHYVVVPKAKVVQFVPRALH
jgi:hypothetical protein